MKEIRVLEQENYKEQCKSEVNFFTAMFSGSISAIVMALTLMHAVLVFAVKNQQCVKLL